jgi:hypothetical protein
MPPAAAQLPAPQSRARREKREDGDALISVILHRVGGGVPVKGAENQKKQACAYPYGHDIEGGYGSTVFYYLLFQNRFFKVLYTHPRSMGADVCAAGLQEE